MVQPLTQRLARLCNKEQALRRRSERIRAQVDVLLLSAHQINEELEAIRAAQDALARQVAESA